MSSGEEINFSDKINYMVKFSGRIQDILADRLRAADLSDESADAGSVDVIPSAPARIPFADRSLRRRYRPAVPERY